MTTIPKWVPPIASANKLQDRRLTETVTADSDPIPVAYGQVQAPGRVFAVDFDDGTWTIGALFCLGEVESVDSILLDGEAPASGVTVNTYVGSTSQTADPLLSAAIASYTDDLVISHPDGDIGVCYCVIQYSNQTYTSFPQILANIQGLKLYDPDSDTTAYSENPSLALRDLIASPHYGHGDAVDSASVIAAAAANDALVSGELGRKIGLLLEQRKPVDDWVEVLATYAGCWAHKRGDTWHLVPDRPAATAKTLTKADGIFAPPAIADAAQVPTVVIVSYTDTSGATWREREAVAELTGVSTGVIPRRESLVRLPGVQRFSQASREALERLSKLQRGLLTGGVTVLDDNIGLEIGDIIEISGHPLYPTHTTFRITEPPAVVSPGRLQVRCSAYSAIDYDDSTPTASWGAGGGVIGRVADIGTVDKTRITRDVSGQNLLGSNAGAEESTGTEFLKVVTLMLDDIGVGVGDVLSFSADVKHSAGDTVQAFLQFRDASSAVGSNALSAEIDSTSYVRVKAEGGEVPAGADRVLVFVKNIDLTASATTRRYMLNLGPSALPFEEPPARVGRGEIEEGADVTSDHAGDISFVQGTAPSGPKVGWQWADTSTSPATVKRWSGSAWVTIGTLNLDADDLPESASKKWAAETGADVTANSPQPPSWLTALIEGGDINAASVESILNALNMINAPAQAGADVTLSKSGLWGSILINPTLAEGDVGWGIRATGGGTWAIVSDAANALFGSWVIKATGVGSNGRFYNHQKVVVSPGSRVLAEGQIKRASGSGSARVRVSFRDSSGVLVGSGAHGEYTASSGYGVSRAIGIAPAGTAYAEFEFQTTGTASTYYCDGAFMSVIPLDIDINALDTLNAPVEAGAEKTTGKSLAILIDRVADNIDESAGRKWGADSGATLTDHARLRLTVDHVCPGDPTSATATIDDWTLTRSPAAGWAVTLVPGGEEIELDDAGDYLITVLYGHDSNQAFGFVSVDAEEKPAGGAWSAVESSQGFSPSRDGFGAGLARFEIEALSDNHRLRFRGWRDEANTLSDILSDKTTVIIERLRI